MDNVGNLGRSSDEEKKDEGQQAIADAIRSGNQRPNPKNIVEEVRDHEMETTECL